MAFFRTRHRSYNTDGSVASTTYRFGTYDDAVPCSQEESVFNALTPAQKLALTSTAAPAVPAGMVVQVRGCSGGSTGPNPDIVVVGDNAGYLPGTNGSGGNGSGFDTSYSFSQAGQDFAGHAFVDTPAPALTAVVQRKPRLTGNAYAFARQSALNTFLSRRHPAFTAPFLVVYAGPGFAQQTERDAILTRGYNLVAENVPNRGLLSRTRIAPLLPGGYDQAQAVADSLPSGDARKSWLSDWKGSGNTHYLMDNPAAAQAFGKRVYQDYQNIDWSNGSPLFGITPNFEVYTANPNSGNPVEVQWRNMDGYFMQGFRQAFLDDLAAKGDGRTLPVLILYDWATMCHYSIKLKSKNQTSTGTYDEEGYSVNYTPEVGVPFYFSYAAIGDNFKGGSATAPLNANNPYSLYAKAYGAYAGSAEYMRNTWPETESFWQKNNDGTLKTRVVNGVTLLVPRTDAFQTTINGEACPILGAGYYSVGEGDNFLYLAHERRQQAIVDTYFRAGSKHLSISTDRQTGWENLKLVQWARFEAEFKQHNEVQTPDGTGLSTNPATGVAYVEEDLNHRPLPGFFIEGDLMMAYFYGRDMYRFWMEPQPELSTQGAANTNSHTRAAHEMAQVAMNRLTQFAWIRQNEFQYILPAYLIRNLGRDRSWYDPNEEFEKKIDFVGGLCDARSDRNDKPYFFFGAQYLAQEVDAHTDVLYWWVDGAGNALTDAYQIRLNGRVLVADDHEVPALVAGLSPSRFRRQFTDMTGEKHTHTGDYRDAKITVHPTPPALAV